MNGVKKEKKNLACNFSTFAWETHIVYACFFFCDTTTVTRATSSMVQVSHKICNVTFLTVEGKKKLSLLLLPSLQAFKDMAQRLWTTELHPRLVFAAKYTHNQPWFNSILPHGGERFDGLHKGSRRWWYDHLLHTIITRGWC